MIFGERLKELRMAHNMSQMDLANALGISQSAIAKWELHKTEPTASAIIEIAKFIDESADYLLGLNE